MKKLYVVLAALALTAVMAFGATGVNARAAEEIEANKAAYVLAVGEIPTGEYVQNGITVYHTKIGDGNAVMSFDLLYLSKAGRFGLTMGNITTVTELQGLEAEAILEAHKDYILTGKNGVDSTVEVAEDFRFTAGKNYRFTVDATAKTFKLESKAIGANDSAYATEAEGACTFESSNMIGMLTVSEGMTSGTAIIDNLFISDLAGDAIYVNNNFDASSSVKAGSMKIKYNVEGADSDFVFKHQNTNHTVRFIDEAGNLLATQVVCVYGSATAPVAPEKEGYHHVGWSEDIVRIEKDMLVYPIYAEGEAPDPTPGPGTDPNPNPGPGTDTESSSTGTNSGTSSPAKEGGCGGAIAGGFAGVIALAGAAIVLKRRND